MDLLKLLLIIILSILAGVGLYWTFNQVKISSNLNSQARSRFSSTCSDPNKVNDAANCLTQNYIITFGSNRANELINQSSTPSPTEATQMLAGLVECGLKCGGAVPAPSTPR
jgi:hypothetical protein